MMTKSPASPLRPGPAPICSLQCSLQQILSPSANRLLRGEADNTKSPPCLGPDRPFNFLKRLLASRLVASSVSLARSGHCFPDNFCALCDSLPSAIKADATERGVGWRWRRAAVLSGAVGAVAAADATIASKRACMAASSGEHGPAKHGIVDATMAAALSPSNRWMVVT